MKDLKNGWPARGHYGLCFVVGVNYPFDYLLIGLRLDRRQRGCGDNEREKGNQTKGFPCQRSFFLRFAVLGWLTVTKESEASGAGKAFYRLSVS